MNQSYQKLAGSASIIKKETLYIRILDALNPPPSQDPQEIIETIYKTEYKIPFYKRTYMEKKNRVFKIKPRRRITSYFR